MWRKGNPPTLSGKVNWCSHYGGTVWRLLKKLKIELPYDLAIPFLSMYLEKTLIQKDTCTPMFIEALYLQ